MKILLIIDQFDSANNGTTISAIRFAQALRQNGNEIRVVSTGDTNHNEYSDGKYIVNEWKLPFVDGIIKSQGMTFAKPNRKTLREAMEWPDVVHFYMPFLLSVVGLKIVKELGIPCTAAFHVQPENITSTIGIGKLHKVNDGIYHFFNWEFFHHFNHIHCPSNFIANQLREHGYKAKLHVISNGIDPKFYYRKLEKSPELQGKFVLVMSGRLSNEKRQDLILDAVAKSAHEAEIQVVLAGQGVKQNALERQGKDLTNPPIIRFFPNEELRDLLAMSDLYIHASDAEIEAISCMEAFASGLVPIIANSPYSATPQFALDERSLFEAGNSDDLAKKIDYWFTREEERKRMELQYAEKGKDYYIQNCVAKIEAMFQEAIDENK